MRELMAVTRALADENRIRILLALREQELCVCQLTELLGLAPSTVSKHVSILRQALLLEGRKEGRWVFYRLAEKEAPKAVRSALRWLTDSLADSTRIAADNDRLREILKIDREELCRIQHHD